MKQKFANALSLALIVAMLFTSVALADNVQNDVVAAGNGTMTAGGSTVVNYKINANNGDGQTGCNAADATPATITINTPPGVTVDTSGNPGTQVTLTFTACDVFLPATFSSITAGDYTITVSVADGGTGTYNTNPATFTLKVLAGTVAVKLAGGPTSGTLSWTKFNSNTTCTGVGNSSSNDNVNSVAFTSLAPVGGGQSIRMTAPTIAGYTFSGWSGAITSASNPVCVIGSSSNQQVTASYTSVPVVQNQTINVTQAAPATAAYGSSFTVSATGGGSGNAVVIASSGACTGGGNGSASITMTSGTGTCTVTYNQAGSSGYNAAPQVTNTTTAQKANATIVVNGYTGLYDGNAHGATGTATGVAGEDLSGSLNLGASFTNVPGGTANWTFTGNANYNNDAGTASIVIGKASQTITVTTRAPASAVYNTQFTVAATGGASGNPVTFSASGACTNVDALFTMTSGTGTCSVHYNQAGNDNYNAATEVAETVNASKASQTITVTTHAPASAVYNTQFTVAATGDASGNAIVYSASGACTNVDALFTMTSGTGTCTVHYNQAGDTNYNAATEVTEAVTAQKANQTISVTTSAPASAVYNTQFTVAATSSSGLAVAYSASGVCSNVGDSFTMTSGTGTCTVHYNQAGDANYNAATEVTEDVTAQKANQTITVGTHAPATAMYNTIFTVAATSSSGLPVDYSSAGGCSNSSATFTMTSGVINCTVKYDQPGNSNYNAAPQITETVTAVAWTRLGFYQPVDMGATVYNIAKNGSTVPLKFEVFAGTTELTTVASIKQSFVQTLQCGTGATDDIESYATGGTSLRYDTSGGQFIFNWQTPKTPGACYKVTLTLLDGSTISANFRLK